MEMGVGRFSKISPPSGATERFARTQEFLDGHEIAFAGTCRTAVYEVGTFGDLTLR